MKDHEIRELINTLTADAKAYGETQQLRQRISEVVSPAITGMQKELQKFHNIMDAHPEFMLFVHAESKSQIRRLAAQAEKNEPQA